jgi:hypothetical protein
LQSIPLTHLQYLVLVELPYNQLGFVSLRCSSLQGKHLTVEPIAIQQSTGILQHYNFSSPSTGFITDTTILKQQHIARVA